MDINKIKEVGFVFFRLGITAFGGPAAHIAMMESIVVDKRKWMSRQYFLDMVGATNLIPGPNSTQMSMHCGQVRAGWMGLIVGGSAFIFPAVILTLLLALIFGKYGEIPAIAPFFYGIKPAVIGIILKATYTLGRKAVKGWKLAIIGVISALASLYGFDEFMIIIGLGLLGMMLLNVTQKPSHLYGILPFFGLKALIISNTSIFMVFLKIALVLFGSGYVLIAYLHAELIDKLGWLTETQLLDAIAMGQFTPGPVLTTATFVGYQINGVWGALYASAGMFLPSFILVGLLVKLIPYLRKSTALSYFLDAVNVASVGIMAAVILQIGTDLSSDWRAIILMVMSIVMALQFPKVSAVWIITGGAFIGYALQWI